MVKQRFTVTVNPTPSDATVTLTSIGETQDGNSIEVDEGASVTYSVSKEGYTEESSTISNIDEDKTVYVVLNEIFGIVEVDASTSTDVLYVVDETGNLYTDDLGGTPFTATVYGEADPIQVEVLETNTITIGGHDFVRLTAGNYNIVDSMGYQLVWDNTGGGNICYIVDGVAETSNMSIVVNGWG